MRIHTTTNNNNFVPSTTIKTNTIHKKNIPTYNDHPENCECEECQEWQEDYNKRNNTTYSFGSMM